MPRESFRIPVEARHVDSVSALLDVPDSTGERADAPALLLAHGAGAPMDSEFMIDAAEGLAARGFPVLRFDYPYMERMRQEGRRFPPDRAPVLEAAHAAALAVLHERFPDRRVLLAGKSMGGRMGSHLAARGADAAGLVFFGYPLHPPKRPEKVRSEHFGALEIPALFLQGTRDALCDLELLREALETYGGAATVHVVEDADHSFRVPKRTGRSQAEVLAELLDATAAWAGR